MNTLATSARTTSNIEFLKNLTLQTISEQYSFEKEIIENDSSMSTKEKISARRDSMFLYLTLTIGVFFTYKMFTHC